MNTWCQLPCAPQSVMLAIGPLTSKQSCAPHAVWSWQKYYRYLSQRCLDVVKKSPGLHTPMHASCSLVSLRDCKPNDPALGTTQLASNVPSTRHRHMNAQTMSPYNEAGRLPKPVCYILVLGPGLQLLHALLSLSYRPHHSGCSQAGKRGICITWTQLNKNCALGISPR